ERSMGEENQYKTEENLECSFCGNKINLLIEIWEYPVGAHNYDEISIDNGEIIQSPDFVSYFWDIYYNAPDEDIFRDR
ncbi:MAG TPA: hypothetical protein PKD85_00790, partial [Saprospiraceae bacterium]|nr:hypothetical protein [Saprospiraceae bacterium]